MPWRDQTPSHYSKGIVPRRSIWIPKWVWRFTIVEVEIRVPVENDANAVCSLMLCATCLGAVVRNCRCSVHAAVVARFRDLILTAVLIIFPVL
jgi:hypothetical protein